RAAQNHFLKKDFIRPGIIDNIRKLNAIAERRGQTLAQMALAWVLRGGRITSALIGASRSAQIVDCVKALENDTFTPEELSEIDLYAREADVNLWAKSAEL
ncbi:aldo/keto reductase, partial [Sinorhizobium meliloti]